MATSSGKEQGGEEHDGKIIKMVGRINSSLHNSIRV